MSFVRKIFLSVLLCFIGFLHDTVAQKIVINEDDSSWREEEIPAQRMAKEEFTVTKRLYQNLVTRFNFYYNTKEDMKKVLAGAEDFHQDNYDSLLSFTPYTINDFGMVDNLLDSVILNAGIGIQTHDPRGKWIDNLYLLLGQAYFFKQEDSMAVTVFRHIIKEGKEKNTEKKSKQRPEVIGSRDFTSKSGISIVSPEKKGQLKHLPARNDAFLWLIKSYRSSGMGDAAASLSSSLKEDPSLPERIKSSLLALEAERNVHTGELIAAISSLQKAVDIQSDKRTKARWQYILSQLYERDKKWDLAEESYRKVGQFQPEQLMRFHAELSQARIRILRDLKNFPLSSRSMVALAQRRKFSQYRSISYQQLGSLALQAGFPDLAVSYLKEGLKYNSDLTEAHAKAYILLADYFFDHRQYREAYPYYDSVSLLLEPPSERINLRKTTLAKVVKNLDLVAKEDSLIHLAQMPRDELLSFLNEIVEDSLKAEKKRNRVLSDDNNHVSNDLAANDKQAESFGKGNKTPDGTWYFYNNATKAKGYTAFKSKWGNRKLQDNWRLGKPSQTMVAAPQEENAIPQLSTHVPTSDSQDKSDLLLQRLLAPIPITPGKRATADSTRMEARYDNVNQFFLQLRSDSASLSAIDTLLKWHPENPYLSDIYYKLYLIYARIPDRQKAEQYKQLILAHYPDSKYAAALNAQPKDSADSRLTSKLYQEAYLKYLSGAYAEVGAIRDTANSVDIPHQYSGQFDLLNAMAILKSQSDGAGIIALQEVVENHKNDTLITDQANRILNALYHKDELVEHLASLQFPDEEEPAKEELPAQVEKTSSLPDSILSIFNKKELQPEKTQEITSIVDSINALNHAQFDSSQWKKLQEEALALQAKTQTDSLDELEREEAKRMALIKKAQADSLATADSLQRIAQDKRLVLLEEERRADNTAAADSIENDQKIVATPYELDKEEKHYVILSFNRTNSELVKKTLEDFAAYNKKNHSRDSIEVSPYVLAQNRVLLIFRLFNNESEAIQYYLELKKNAANRIIPQVASNYYSFFFISRKNFSLLNSSQDFKGYLEFFYRHYK